MADLTLDPKKLSKEQLERAALLLQREEERKEKIKKGLIKAQTYAEMTPEQKEKARMQSRRYEARKTLYVLKAREAGIEVTDQEIDEFVAKKAQK